MFDYIETQSGQAGEALQLILTGLESRNEMSGADIEVLKRELRALSGAGQARFTSKEQLKAEKIIGYVFRPSVDACLNHWFGKSEETDVNIWRRFGEDVGRASDGAYDHWALSPEHPRMFLALIVLLDQFRRNMYRESAEMYAADARCMDLVKRAIRHGTVDKLRLVERVFPCLVLTHSEAIEDQRLCVQEWGRVEAELVSDDPLRVFRTVFERHLEVIEKFGRFPHRNKLLDRASTAEEETFLQDATFRFDLPLVKTPDGEFRFQGTVKGSRVGPVEGEAVSLGYDGPDVAMTRVNEEIRLKGYSKLGDVTLHKYIVEREVPDIGFVARDEIMAKVDRSSRAVRQLWPRLSWVESYICDNKIYCVFLSDSPETLRAHALLTDMPLNTVHQVAQVVVPEMAEEG